MPDQYQYVKLPDGSLGKFNATDDDATIKSHIAKDFPNAYKGGPPLQMPTLAKSPQLAPLARPLGPIPGAMDTSHDPSLWSRTTDALSKVPLVNTQTPYGISRGASVGGATGLEGYSKAVQGGQEFMMGARERNPRYMEQGASRAAGGAFEAATPLMIGAAGAAPLPFAASMLGSEVGGRATTAAAKAAGVSPEGQELWGTVGSVIGASLGGGVEAMREYRGTRVERLTQDYIKTGMGSTEARAAALKNYDLFKSTGNAKYLDPFGERPTVAEAAKGGDPFKAPREQAVSGAAGAAKAALLQSHGEDHSKEITDIKASLPARENATALASPIPGQPGPGLAEYEAMRRKVSRLEGAKTVDSPEFAAAPKPDYLKQKLRLTETGRTELDRQKYPDNQTMAARHMERYKIAAYDAERLQKAGADPTRIEQVKTEGLRALTTWGQYATREDVDATLASLRTNLDEQGAQLAKARDVTRNLLEGKLSFSALKPGADQITRAEFTKIAGHDLPTIPKGFVDTLPKDIQTFIEGAKSKDAKEMIVRQWGAKYLTDRMLDVIEQHTKTSEVAAAIAKGKQIDPATISRYMVLSKEGVKPPVPEVPIEEKQFNYARSAMQAGVKLYGKGNFKVTEKAGKFRVERITPSAEVSPRPEVGRTQPEPAQAKAPEPVHTAEPPKGPGESVPATQGPKIEPLPPLQNLEGSLRVTDKSAMETINRDMERRGLSSPGQNLGRRIEDRAKESNPVLSEDAAAKPPAPTPEQGLADSTLFNELVQNYVKKGMARGTAEVMARNKIERERGSFSLWQKRQASVSPQNSALTHMLEQFGSRTNLVDVGPEEQTGRNIMRSVFGERARSIDQLYNKFNKVMQEHEADSVQDLIRFNNAAERKPGAQFLNTKDQAVADAFQDVYQNVLWPTLQQINPEKFGVGIENYMARLFKGKKGQAIGLNSALANSPFEGGKGFTRHRINDWIDESISHGAEPVTNNPVKMQMLAMSQIVKYISAHKAFGDMKDHDIVKWVKYGGTPDPGWQRVDDSIFKPRRPIVTQKGAIVGTEERGNFFAHPDVARIFNNWIKPGLRGNKAYDTTRAVADTQNMIQLGFSGFHFTFTSMLAATSDVAVGFQQALNYGKPLKGLGNIAKGITILPSMIDNYRLGHMMREEWLVPGTHPWIGKYADLMEDVGGGIGTTSLLSEGQRIADFHSAIRNLTFKSSPKTGFKAIGALAEWAGKPLMQKYVPNLKMGVFAKMAADHYEKLLAQGASPDEIRTAIGKDWNSVDNRMGLLRTDNLFWPKMARDLSRLAIRSVTWNTGTIAEGLGGLLDAGKLFHGEGLSPRLAFVAALPVVVGSLGGVMHYLMTGQRPQKPEDYFYPGPDGAKVSLPGYHNFAFQTIRSINAQERPGDVFLAKLHPIVQQSYELWSNQDWYGTEIKHEGDGYWMQKAEQGKYLLTHNLPISFQSGLEEYNRTADWEATAKRVGMGELGLLPAPKYIGQTKAEQATFDYAKRQWAIGPRTTSEFTRRQTMYQLRWKQEHDTLKAKDIDRAIDSGRITPGDANTLDQESGLTPFQREFKSIGLQAQLDILSKYATDDEKSQLEPLVKWDTYDRLLPDEQADIDRKFQSMEK